MSDKNEETKSIEATPVEVECPKCNHKFWHKIGDGFKKVGGKLGEAIGEVKFGGN